MPIEPDMKKLEFIFLYDILSCKDFSLNLVNYVPCRFFQFLHKVYCIPHVAIMHPVINIQLYLFVGPAYLHPEGGGGGIFIHELNPLTIDLGMLHTTFS